MPSRIPAKNNPEPRRDRIGARSEQRQQQRLQNKTKARSSTTNSSGSPPKQRSASVPKKFKSEEFIYDSDEMAGDTTAKAKKEKVKAAKKTAKATAADKKKSASGTAASKRKASTDLNSSSPAPARKRRPNDQDLDFHPEYEKILNKDFSMVPATLQDEEGPRPSSFRRLEAGTWKNEHGEVKTAWMFPMNSAGWKEGSGKAKLQPTFVKEFGQSKEGNSNQLKRSEITFLPVFKNDERFAGKHETYKGASTRQDKCDHAWMAFLTDAYFHVLPNERPKIELKTTEEKKNWDEANTTNAQGGQSNAPADDDEDDLEAEEDEEIDQDEVMKSFRNDFPKLVEDVEVWDAYDRDTHRFDLTKPYICQRIRMAWPFATNKQGRDGPPGDILREALLRKRITGPGTTCSSMTAFLSWDVKETDGAKTFDLMRVKSPIENIEDIEAGRAELPIQLPVFQKPNMSDDELQAMCDPFQQYMSKCGYDIRALSPPWG